MYSRVRIMAAAMVAVAVAFATSAVQASFYTELATVNINGTSPSPGVPAPIPNIGIVDTASGRVFTNSTGVNPDGSIDVRSVGVLIFSGVTQGNGNTINGLEGPGASTDRIAVAFALDGHTVAGPGGATTVQFTSGGAGFWQASNTFNRDDPTQWFNDFKSPVWTSAIAAQTNIFIGNGDTVGGFTPGDLRFPSNLVNLSSINAIDQTSIQGQLLFNENFDPNHFLDTTTNFQGGPTTGVGIFDSLLARENLTIGNQAAASNLLNADTSGGGTAAQKQAVVNNLAAFFGLSNLGGANTGFADFGSGTATDYLPGGSGLNNTGDFAATATVELYPGLNNVIPEPSTFGLMAIGSVAIGFFARFGSKRKS